jgi:hypothetical protein
LVGTNGRHAERRGASVSKGTWTIRNPAGIDHALRCAREAILRGLEGGKTVVLKATRQTRSLEQNAYLHVILGDVARQVVWHGQKYDVDTWKAFLMLSFGKEMMLMPGINGGLVPIPHKSSKLTVPEMNDFIAYVLAFGTDHGVRWTAPKRYEE